MIRVIVLVAAIYLGVIAQEFLPAASFLGGARLLVVPAIFCLGALSLPFPAVLGLALYTGLVSDLAALHVAGEQVEIGLGWSMVFYIFVGSVLQIMRMMSPRGRWEIHCLVAGTVTLLLVLLQYLMVCLRREEFFLHSTVLLQIIGPALIALFVAPVLYFFYQLLPEGSWAEPRRQRRLNP
jgi:hypothetical protein